MNITSNGLNSSMKAKFRAIKTLGETLNDESSVTVCDRSRLRTSIHTIGVKESPQKSHSTLVGFGEKMSQCSNQPHTPPKVLAKRHSPISKIMSISNIPTGQGLKSSQSVLHLGQVQGILVTQDKRQGSRSRQREGKEPVQPFETISGDSVSKKRISIKPRLSQDRHFVKVQMTQQSRRLSSTKLLPAPPSMRNLSPNTTYQSPSHQPPSLIHNSTSQNPSIYKTTTPTKHKRISLQVPQIQVPVLKQIQQNKIPRQVQLERKIKVLEIRVGELHLEKGVMQTKMNELIIRLQYENNFLKEKLNSYPSLTQIGGMKPTETNTTFAQVGNNLKVIDQVLSQPSQNSLFFTCPIRPTTRKSIENSLSSDSSRSQAQNHRSLNIQFVNTQEHFFNGKGESQEILGLRQKLLEVEEMLSKEVGKNLQLLEEMGKGEKVREQMGEELKKLQASVQELRKQVPHLDANAQPTPIAQFQHATQSARIPSEFQDKILSLQMQISWLNQKLQQAQKLSSSVRLELNRFNAVSKVELVDREQIFGKLEVVKENAELREQIEGLRAQCLEGQHGAVELRVQYEECVRENEQLREQISHLNNKLSTNTGLIPEQVLQQHEQSNKILLSTIKSLENSLSFSQQSIHQLMNQKIDLQSKIHHLELQLNHYAYKEQQYELEVQTIGGKLQEIGELVQGKTRQVQELNRRMCDKDWEIQDKQDTILRLECQIQTLEKERAETKAISTQNSYYDTGRKTSFKGQDITNYPAEYNPYINCLHEHQQQPITPPISSPTFRPL